MSRWVRNLAACGLVLVGAMVALFWGGGQVGGCLGPLGVTAVQCAKATGVIPGVGIGQPVLAASVALATFFIWPVPTVWRSRVVVGGLVGGAIGVLAFLASRPLTMEGFDSRGIWISIARPLDPYALATSVIVAALLGSSLMRLAHRRTRSRGPEGQASGLR